MHKILPFLWFDGRAEEAAEFYVGTFDDCRITDVMRWGEGGPAPAGSVLTVSFEVHGQPFVALNGGPHYQFTPAVSFLVNCQTQDEIDRIWARLLDGGQAQQCGWITDRFGLTWQIVPAGLQQMLASKDSARAQRTMQAMLQMVKLDLPTLERAFQGNAP
jgi:predicted 3-demethylubiquinone-9 3-methyltransferase (glyoxalase superfamily)